MSLENYLNTIEAINPGKIFVENVRSVLNVSHKRARLYCEMAVLDKVFEKRLGIVCPQCGRIISEFDIHALLPPKISCSVCEHNDEEIFEFETAILQKKVYYKLK
jgi:hypothetical protein